MNLKLIAILGGILLIVGVVILASTNNFFLVIALACAIIAVYFFLEWRAMQKEPIPPYTMLRTRMIQAVKQCDPRTLGYLILRGDSDFQRITLGRMVGIVEWNLTEPKTEKQKKQDKTDEMFKGWEKVLIIGYTTKYKGLWTWPLIRSFVPVELFAVARHQLWDAPGVGDLRLKGTSIEPVYMFWMLNSVDLHKDYVGKALGDEVERLTLEGYFDKLPRIIEDAVKSDGFQLKLKELFNDKPKNKTGII